MHRLPTIYFRREFAVAGGLMSYGSDTAEGYRQMGEYYARAYRRVVVEHGTWEPLRPKAVKFVGDLPKTRNAKIMRRVIRGKYLGRDDLGDLSSLENPAAVDEIAHAR